MDVKRERVSRYTRPNKPSAFFIAPYLARPVSRKHPPEKPVLPLRTSLGNKGRVEPQSLQTVGYQQSQRVGSRRETNKTEGKKEAAKGTTSNRTLKDQGASHPFT